MNNCDCPLENLVAVVKNDNDIKRQVPGITTKREKALSPSWLKDQEFFYRATNYIGG